MDAETKKKAFSDLQRIPGVGPSIAGDLFELGFTSVEQLKCADPEKMYTQHCLQKGMQVDRCVLYVFRCAVYFATETKHEPEKLKWWSWKD